MSSIQSPLDSAEAERLDACVLEQIHVPGAIQPHGVLLTVDLDTFTILQASSNAGDVLATTVDALLGSPLQQWVGTGPIEQFRDILNWEGFGSNPVSVSIGERRFDAIFHETDGLGVVEFELQSPPRRHHSAASIYAAAHRLAGASTIEDLLAWTARELRNLTKFDHVMVYEFHPDEHGEVVAEARATDVQTLLGLHFPASDIPIQARRLYLKKLSRVIVNTETPTAHLVPPEHPATGQPVNLSLSELRAISPRHLEFMKNIGQASTMSFSLVQNGELIGMITCAHRAAIHIPYALRQGYEILARQVALQWGAMREIDRLTHRERLREVRMRLLEQIGGGRDIREALVGYDLTIADLVHADGAAVRFDGTILTVGDAPDPVQIERFFERLAAPSDRHLVTESLPIDRPDLSADLPGVAGLAVVPFGIPGNYMAWFRGEIVRTVEWLGDQTPSNRVSPLSPRSSFAAWSNSVSGRSTPWDELELVEAAELSRDLDTLLLNMTDPRTTKSRR